MSDGVTKHEVSHGRVRGIIFKPKGKGPFKGDALIREQILAIKKLLFL